MGTKKHDADQNIYQCGKMWTRRSFLQAAAIAGMGAVFSGTQAACATKTESPRAGRGNLFLENGKPLLVAVEGTDFQKMLVAGVAALGGLDKLVSGKKVVLKPNIIASEPPPVTTDGELMISLAKLVQITGARSVSVCDGNSSGVSKTGKFEGLGLPLRLEEAGVGLDAVDFGDRLAHVFVEKKTWQMNPRIGVARTLQEAEVIINLPVIKRHGASRFTCALKNHFGSVYGPLRFVAHRKMDNEEGGKLFFDRSLAEFADAVRPELNIVDGRSILIRGGPTLSGKAAVKKGINKIIFCGDMVAADVYCSKIMEEHDDSYSSAMIADQLTAAEELGLGVRDLNNVVVKEVTA